MDKLKATWNKSEINDANKDEIDYLPLNKLLAKELALVKAIVGFNLILSEVDWLELWQIIQSKINKGLPLQKTQKYEQRSQEPLQKAQEKSQTGREKLL